MDNAQIMRVLGCGCALGRSAFQRHATRLRNAFCKYLYTEIHLLQWVGWQVV